MNEPTHPVVEQQTLESAYDPEITPLKTGGRADWRITSQVTSEALERPDFVDAMRRFFAEMDDEITARSDDPIALTQGLVRLEALMADIRFVRDRMRDVAARGLKDANIRRLVVEGLCNVEAQNTTADKNWDHKAVLMRVMRGVLGEADYVNPDTGELLSIEELADTILSAASVNYWRMGSLREQGINPYDYFEQETDEDGKPVKYPSIRIHDNRLRTR